MITTRIIPPATATEQQLLVEITENVCKPYCINSENLPTGNVSFSVGAVRVVNGIAIATIVAKVTIAAPVKNCGCAQTMVHTEAFDVAFTATATNAIALAEGVTANVTPAFTRCCKARGVRLTTTLTVTIA